MGDPNFSFSQQGMDDLDKFDDRINTLLGNRHIGAVVENSEYAKRFAEIRQELENIHDRNTKFNELTDADEKLRKTQGILDKIIKNSDKIIDCSSLRGDVELVVQETQNLKNKLAGLTLKIKNSEDPYNLRYSYYECCNCYENIKKIMKRVKGQTEQLKNQIKMTENNERAHSDELQALENEQQKLINDIKQKLKDVNYKMISHDKVVELERNIRKEAFRAIKNVNMEEKTISPTKIHEEDLKSSFVIPANIFNKR